MRYILYFIRKYGEGNEGVEYIAEWVIYEDAENRVNYLTYVVSVIKVGYGGKN